MVVGFGIVFDLYPFKDNGQQGSFVELLQGQNVLQLHHHFRIIIHLYVFLYIVER
ncbi:hypothetical protein D3C85_1781730 [compost metagenome]